MQQISLRTPWIYHPPAKCLSTGLTCLTHGLLHLFCVCFVCFPIIIDLLNLYDEHLAQNQPHNGKYCVREKNSWWKRVAVAFFSPLWSPCSSIQSATACTRWKSPPPSSIHTCILPIRNWCQGLVVYLTIC